MAGRFIRSHCARERERAMIAGILLAAGRSDRFDGDKLLHPLGDGMPLGVRAAVNLRLAIERCYAVVADRERPLVRLFEAAGLSVVPCARSGAGMGASIACGVRAAKRAAGYVIALADMPFVDSTTIRRVAEALTGGAICAAPVYRGRRGHPVGFSAGVREELLALKGEWGAREVLHRLAARTQFIEVDDAGILRDVDRPGDLFSEASG